jgi:hypothetical protein
VARIYNGQAVVLIRRPPSAVFGMFRCQMLAAFRQWIVDSKPTPDEIASEIDATISAMKQIAEVA